MDLLPKTHKEFAETEYWNKFFKKRGEKAFEWYGEYLQLCDQLHKYIKPKDKILMAGCGNSQLSMDMYDSGFKDIVNIDISPVVIKNMLYQNQKSRPSMEFLQMDATSMTFERESFSVVLDKGTLDALMTDDSDDVKNTVSKYFDEIGRVLSNAGRYVCISLLQKHILKFVLEYLPKNSFMIRVIRCFDAEQYNAENSPDSIAMPVFFLVATKFKSLPVPIFEVGLGGNKMKRLSSPVEVLEAVSAMQNAAMICNSLSKGTTIEGLDEISMDLYKPGTEQPRYTVYILDQAPLIKNGKYAAFIVPQGREVEWLFSTTDGRKKLLASAKHNRLAIVTMHGDENYTSLDAVKEEIADSIKNLAPHGLKEQIPFLSIGSDVGIRQTLASRNSELSGDFRIEEVQKSDGNMYRRLIFLGSQSIVQSEALIKTTPSKSNKSIIDVGYLACSHHLFMAVGVQMTALKRSEKKDILVIGLGGGSLCTFMHKALTNVRITAVEIDEVMLNVAEEFFELKQDDRLKVVIDDGLKFIQNCKNDNIHYDAILFDVDSKDLTLGMSCPPKAFLEAHILECIKFMIGDKGLFILNLVCRDDKLRIEVKNSLKNIFNSICCYQLDEDVNEVIYCSNNTDLLKQDDWIHALEVSCRSLNSLVKKRKLYKTEMINVTKFLDELKL